MPAPRRLSTVAGLPPLLAPLQAAVAAISAKVANRVAQINPKACFRPVISHPPFPIRISRYSMARENWRLAYVDPVPSAACADCLVTDERAVELRGVVWLRRGKLGCEKRAPCLQRLSLWVAGLRGGWASLRRRFPRQTERSTPATRTRAGRCGSSTPRASTATPARRASRGTSAGRR